MSICVSLGAYGGFYFSRGWSWRLCLGWLAVTVFPCDLDRVLDRLTEPKPLPYLGLGLVDPVP